MSEAKPARAVHVPLPLLGPGSQQETDALHYLEMPQGMATYQAPRLPEPEALSKHAATRQVLRAALDALDHACAGEHTEPIWLDGLKHDDLALLDSLLGEGEVSVRAGALRADGTELRVQESVFAGLWRVAHVDADGRLVQRLQVARFLDELIARARADGERRGAELSELPSSPGLMNAPAILAELAHAWTAPEGAAAHVVNLTLLPVTPDDAACLDAQLGTGSVVVLSRGYGNCRITSTARRRTWRVVYYNSQDKVILETIEVTDVPEVACAASADFSDSRARLADVLAWLEQP